MEEKKYVRQLKPHREINKSSVVKIGAKWCGACQQNKSVYEHIASRHSLREPEVLRRSHTKEQNVSFYEVDMDRFSGEKSVVKIVNKMIKNTTSLPTFYFVRDGKIVNKMEGYSSEIFRSNLKKIRD